MLYEIDIPKTQLLVSAVIASVAVLGAVISLTTVARQLRHQNRLESKRVEQDQINHLLRVLDRPLDVCLANIMDIDFIRATTPAALASPQALHQFRPTLVSEFRSAYQDFTNVATTAATVIPRCRERRGINPANDPLFASLNAQIGQLVEAYNDLGSKYANVGHLIGLNMTHWQNDPLQENALNLVTAVRHHSSALLASLYG